MKEFDNFNSDSNGLLYVKRAKVLTWLGQLATQCQDWNILCYIVLNYWGDNSSATKSNVLKWATDPRICIEGVFYDPMVFTGEFGVCDIEEAIGSLVELCLIGPSEDFAIPYYENLEHLEEYKNHELDKPIKGELSLTMEGIKVLSLLSTFNCCTPFSLLDVPDEGSDDQHVTITSSNYEHIAYLADTESMLTIGAQYQTDNIGMGRFYWWRINECVFQCRVNKDKYRPFLPREDVDRGVQ